MSNPVLATYRKNLLALDAALDAVGGPSLRDIMTMNVSAADLLDTLAEKGIEIRAVAPQKECSGNGGK